MVASGGEHTYYEKIRYFLKKTVISNQKQMLMKTILCVYGKKVALNLLRMKDHQKLNLKVVV